MVIAIDVGTAMVACGLSNKNRGQVWVFWLFPVKSMIPGESWRGFRLEQNSTPVSDFPSGSVSIQLLFKSATTHIAFELEVNTSSSMFVETTFGKAFIFAVPTNCFLFSQRLSRD
ncbi:uncharacterized protein LOC111242057 [Vigna radiata var. radiata]|uniref:Uncharacterized protein LOC111242057 n=1 Tax=Vigna radiata var. radiata TaxID=3916 RepID=A0A3Q0F512_VIGRR|nr:uncharacterized protein LOC111242057 [Vigna radiata var. radiata]